MNSGFKREKGLLPNSSAGFTLLEVLLAIAILSVALLGMATLTGSIIGSNQLADQTTTATTLAQNKIEEFKNKRYSSITTYSDSPSIYTRTWTVTPNKPDTDMKYIEVKVEWTSKGQAHDVVLKTIVAK